MQIFQTNESLITGSTYGDVKNRAFLIYFDIKSKSKRKPYVRSAYFNREKVFLNIYWDHIFQKSPKERYERLKYFKASIYLINNSRNDPEIKQNKINKEEIQYRFYGKTIEKDVFCVQIKENVKNNKKYFISNFPIKNPPPMMWSV